MDNPSTASHTNKSDRASIWASPELRPQLKTLEFSENVDSSFWRIILQNEVVSLYENGGLVFSLSNNIVNLRFIESIVYKKSHSQNQPHPIEDEEIISLYEYLLSGQHMPNISEFKKFWQSLLNSFSLQATLEAYIKISSIHGFTSAVCLIHPKGESNAWELSPLSFANEIKPVSINDFNSLFQSLKKTKNKHFSSSSTKWSWLPINGVFVADTFSYKKYNVIWINSREEFLHLSETEHARFKLFSKIITIWFERLVELEFSDIKSSNVIWLIEHIPIEISIKDSQDRVVFTNTHFREENLGSMSWAPLPRGYRLGYIKDTDTDDFEIDAFQKQKVLLLGDLFNTLRHELSNPLFGLRLSAELVLNSVDDTEFKSIFSQVLGNIQRSQSIIHNLSKLYSGEQNDTNFDIIAIIKESITLAKSELKGIQVDVSGINLNDTLIVEAKPVAVVQIIFNLIVNSAQALRNSLNKPIIKIEVKTEDNVVRVLFSDNGPGLPASIRDNLFKPFHTTKSKGHGLGLALSKDLALKLGGNLEYSPTDNGTMFILSLKKFI